MIVELICFAILAFLVIYYLFLKQDTKLPPGPRPWPIIGNASLLFCSNLFLHLTELGKKYGNVMTVYMGSKPMVVLGGRVIKEALVNQSIEFASRPPRAETFRFDEAQFPSLFFMEYGPAWRLFRKLGHQSIKVYGQERLQEVMDAENDDLCRRLENWKGKPCDVNKEFAMSVMNVICNQLFGSRYDIDDPEFLEIYRVHDVIIHTPVQRSILEFIPSLKRFFPGSHLPDKELREAGDWRDDLMVRKYREHLETLDEDNIRDYTDALLKAKLDAEREDSTAKNYLTEQAILRAGLATVFLAGSETTASTLGWAVRYLLHNPDVQDRLHQELDQVFGPDETPTLDSKRSLPLLEAFITETLRMSSVLPLSVLRRTTADTTLKGYEIPKGTIIVPNLWSLHHDPSIWADPFKFRLERYLNDEGKFVSPPTGTFYPFSAGRRACMGEVFARSELFLFLAGVLKKFRFVNPPNAEPPSLYGGEGLVMTSEPYQACVIKREA